MDDGTQNLLNRIMDRLTDHTETLNDIKVVQAEQKVVLDEHIRRTELNEQALDVLKDELKPLQKKEAMVDGVLRFLGGLAILAGILVSIKDLLF